MPPTYDHAQPIYLMSDRAGKEFLINTSMKMRELIKLVEDAADLGYTLDAYHGTGTDFTAFRYGHSAKGAGSRESPLGFWFTNNPEAASGFAHFAGPVTGANVMPVKLRMRNPLVVDHYSQIKDIVDRFTTFERPGYVIGRRNIRMAGDKVDYEAARQWLKSEGYDGIVLKNTLTDSPDGDTPIDQYIVFDPSQVRSRYAKFDPSKGNSDDIRETEKPT